MARGNGAAANRIELFPTMKRWHGVMVGLAALAIGAYLAMIVGPHATFGRITHPVPERTTL